MAYLLLSGSRVHLLLYNLVHHGGTLASKQPVCNLDLAES